MPDFITLDAVNAAVDTLKTDLSLIKVSADNASNAVVNVNASKTNTDSILDIVRRLLNQNVSHGAKDIIGGTEPWTCPDGVYYVYAILHSGSGGGGGSGGSGNGLSPSSNHGGGGGSGAEWFGIIPVTPGTTYNLVVGGGGAGGNMGYAAGQRPSYSSCSSYSNTIPFYTAGNAGGSGTAGGNTTFGGIVTCIGGGGGTGSTGSRTAGSYCTGGYGAYAGDAGVGGSAGYISFADRRKPFFRLVYGNAGSYNVPGSDGYITGGWGGAGAAGGAYSLDIGYNGNAGGGGSNGFLYFVW